MDRAGPYIKGLLDNITEQKQSLGINMNTMNNKVPKECSDSMIDGIGGYIGYSKCNDKQSKIEYIELHLMKYDDTNNIQDPSSLCPTYQYRFNCIGLKIFTVPHDELLGTQHIAISI